MVTPTHFKGWAKPGPVPPGAESGATPGPGEMLDAISGHFRILQLREGHRFSTDDLLTAWYGTTWVPSAHDVLDLGSGIGSVGMIGAWRLPGARFVTIEAQQESVELARRSATYNGLAGRYDIRWGDFREEGLLRSDEQFDLVLGSPPYFPAGTGAESDHPQKSACRFELRGDVADYARTAAKHLRAGGLFACIYLEARRAYLEQSADAAGLTLVRSRPVVFREGDDPLVGLFAFMRAGDLPASMHGRGWLEPALVVRRADGSVHPEYAAIKLSIGFPP